MGDKDVLDCAFCLRAFLVRIKLDIQLVYLLVDRVISEHVIRSGKQKNEEGRLWRLTFGKVVLGEWESGFLQHFNYIFVCHISRLSVSAQW